MTDHRAVSAVLSYMLTLMVIALLTAGLFTTAGTILENQQERALRSELTVIGNRIAAGITAVDQLAAAAGTTGDAELTANLPKRVVDNPYRIEISPLPGTTQGYRIVVSTEDPSVFVEVRVRTATDVVAGSTAGGDMIIGFNGSVIEVRNA